MNNFDREWEKMGKRQSLFRKMFFVIFAFVFIAIIAQFSLMGYFGYKAAKTVDEQGLGTAIGRIYKDFKEAAK